MNDADCIMQDVSARVCSVKGSVSLLSEFAEAFKCPFDSKMHPRVACLIW